MIRSPIATLCLGLALCLPNHALAAIADKEVALRIEVTEAIVPDSATFAFDIGRTRQTAEAARAARDSEAQRVIEALVAMGIERSKIAFEPNSLHDSIEQAAAAEATADCVAQDKSRRTADQRTDDCERTALEPRDSHGQVRVAQARLELLPKIAELGDGNSRGERDYSMLSEGDEDRVHTFASNPDAARRAAIDAALAKARKEADMFAESLGLRIVRIVAVGNQGQESFMDAYAGLMVTTDWSGRGQKYRSPAPGNVAITVEYALVQR